METPRQKEVDGRSGVGCGTGKSTSGRGTERAVALKREFGTRVCRSVVQVEERCEVGCTGERVSVSGLVCLAASGDIL